jgi:hypothetical protein
MKSTTVIIPDDSNLIIPLPEKISSRIDPRTLMQFNNDQKMQIISGINEGLDVSVYAKPELDAMDMAMIKKAMKKGMGPESIDILITYLRTGEFNKWQMEQILIGLESAIDPSIYAKPEIHSMLMKTIREGIGDKGLPPEQIGPYIDPRLDYQQMGMITTGLKDGLDVSKYANPELTHDQMKQLFWGARAGIDVEPYSNPIYSSEQMAILIRGARFKDGGYDIDESLYADPTMSESLMSCIMLLQVHGYGKENIRGFVQDVWENHPVLNEGVISHMDGGQVDQIARGYANGIDPSIYVDPIARGRGSIAMSKVVDALIGGIDIKPYLPSPADLTEWSVDDAIRRAKEKKLK